MAVCHILPELTVKRNFLAVYFVNTNPEEGIVKVLLSEKKLTVLSDDSQNISKKSNTDCYTERPSATFCNRTYSILEDFGYARNKNLHT